MSSKRIILTLVFSISLFYGYSQEKAPVKFGSVSEKDFATKVYSLDSNASAVVIADIGTSTIEGNNKGWFSLQFKHYKRVHILNKNGFDIANVSVSLYSDGTDEESLDKLKAVTYNLENGKVVETKLDVKEAVFKDKISKEWVVKKFTFPNVKEGSIIEYEYTKKSDFLNNLESWEYQGSYPRLWSEYNVSIPDFLGYVFLRQGYKNYDFSDRKSRHESYTVLNTLGYNTERYQLSSNVSDYRWVMKNVPALKEESFTSTLQNHISKIEFQLAEYRSPLTYRNLIESWAKVAGKMLASESFGEKLSKDNGWLDDITRPLVAGAKDMREKAFRIYNYVRDNFTCTDHSDLWAAQTLKNIVKSKNGTVSEINLLLTAMLKHENIPASPIILSTRANGKTYEMYPLLSQYNYVAVRATVDNQNVFLDASEPRLGFGHLPIRCYNGHARIIDETGYALDISSDTLMEVKNTSVFLINDEKSNIVGSMTQMPGYYESLGLRDRVKEKGQEELVKSIKKDFGQEISIANFKIDSLEKYEDNLTIRYDFDLLEEKEDILYFNPLFGEGYKENPFKAAERSYPVEMPYGFDETYTLQMEVPAGYVVDELPKPMVVKMNEAGEGFFEYRISQSGSGISFRSRVRLARAYFQPDEYEMLREFFNLIVKKQAEQIVFKKKK
ncbi:MAG: DUF3857 domain-containing protein [Chitinophagales bacterium]|nr:DUF3857 domain-containing protein [Chitinophagales bacterium]